MASYNQTLAMRYNRQGEEAVVDGHLHLAIKYFTDAIALWPNAESFGNRAFAFLESGDSRPEWRMAVDDFLVAAVIAFDDYWGEEESGYLTNRERRDYADYIERFLAGASYTSLFLTLPPMDEETRSYFRLCFLAMLNYYDFYEALQEEQVANDRFASFINSLEEHDFDREMEINTAQIIPNYRQILGDSKRASQYLKNSRREDARILADRKIGQLFDMMQEMLRRTKKEEF